MKKTVAVVIFFLSAVCAFSQSPVWLNPLPTGQGISDIAFFDEIHAIMCGTNGTILTSADGGNNWQEQTTGDFSDFAEIAIAGSSVAYLLADNFMLKTTDYGNSFSTIATLPSGYTYKGINMYSENEGYALRYNASLAQPYELGYTGDGGHNWTWTPFPSDVNTVYTICFSDNLHGTGFIGKSSYAYLVFTDDGGNTWQTSSYSWETVSNSTIRYSNSGNFYAAYSTYYAQEYETHILKSTDQGQTWTEIYGPQGGDGNLLSDFKILGDDLLFMAAVPVSKKKNSMNQSSSLLYSTDGGITWTPGNFAGNINPGEPTALGLKNMQEAFLSTLGGYMDRLFFRTFSTGYFEPFSEHNFPGNIADLSFGSSRGYLFITDGTETLTRVSNDGGNTWTAQPQTTEGMPFRGVFTSDNYGYLCTFSADSDPISWIHKTNNGAQSYSLIKTNTPGSPLMFEAFGPDTVMILTSSPSSPDVNKMERSADGGTTWEQVNVTTEKVYTADFIDGMHGYLFGGATQGKIWRTLDGGNTWVDFFFLTGPFTKGMVLSPNLALASTLHEGVNKILKINLQEFSAVEIFFAPTDHNIIDFRFSDENNGYVITYKNHYRFLYKTTNAGQDWTLLGVYNDINRVVTFYNDNGFAFGSNQLLRLSSGFPLKVNEKEQRDVSIQVFSLPGQKSLQINFRKEQTLPGNLEIYDTRGSLIHRFAVSFSGQKLTHRLKPGIYLYRYTGNKANVSGKFVVNY
ncbi:MAG: hypothetical protein PWR20_701 [Bacteroidales bacterium]|jgi:photosystem II stability/assembly factor-like uncharacterized protein|nr:hypothetical protein [Bacteroidales bacterium]MDN5329149.1 hypothetical protein [Bacteroidales bacterium]